MKLCSLSWQGLQKVLSLPVHEKLTFTGRMRTRQNRLREKLIEGKSNTLLTHTQLQLQDTPAWRVSMINDLNIHNESMAKYIAKKRELFLLEYSLAVKRGEIQLLEQMTTEEEKKLIRVEKLLNDDAILFEEFLKEHDKNAVDAIKIAEQETKVKLEKIAEIKKITCKMGSIKSDISKYEDILKEHTKYKEFLMKLSPPEWQEKQRSRSRSLTDFPAATNIESDGKQTEKFKKNRERKTSPPDSRSGESRVTCELSSTREARVQSRQVVKSSHQNSKIAAFGTDSSDNKEDPELFFTDPQELLNLITELEEQNISLIQNSKEREEALEEFRKSAELTCKNMESETKQLKQHIDIMTDTIQREKTAELELRSRLLSFRKYKLEDQDKTLDIISRKVEEAYHSCVGETEAKLSTLLMLTAIEDKLGELLENADRISRNCMTIAERVKEKQRRIRLRDEKILLQMKHQEERQKKALERSHAEIKKMSVKKMMPRSPPPVCKLQTNKKTEITAQEKEELLYFFS
ncbi:cilia- and flagella-associated protein 100 [Myxocyprinus asiaticus]|uniref:cilia- and flagella-associated protein 100 n=1 Tax=Myxocyprinus asiaticus TaxID=70543 RepID=UPI002222693F|nr:cilia- and flagella-associated protein 100 [Myxocyprinus asiaticus]